VKLVFTLLPVLVHALRKPSTRNKLLL